MRLFEVYKFFIIKCLPSGMFIFLQIKNVMIPDKATTFLKRWIKCTYYVFLNGMMCTQKYTSYHIWVEVHIYDVILK